VSQFLFASKTVLGRLNRCVPQQKLNLLELAASQVRQSCAGTAQVMRSEILDTGTFRSHFDDMPDGFKCEALAPDLSRPTYSPEERTCAYPGCIGLLIHSALRPRWNQDCADVLSFANKVGDHPMFLTDLKISQLTAASEFRTAFFDCSKSGSRSSVLGLERLVVFSDVPCWRPPTPRSVWSFTQELRDSNAACGARSRFPYRRLPKVHVVLLRSSLGGSERTA